MNKPLLLLAPLVLASFWTGPQEVPLETEPLDFFPADTLALVELRGTSTWLTRAHADELVAEALRRGWLEPAAQRKLLGALGFAQLTIGAEPIDRLGQLTAEGVLLGLLPGSAEPTYVLVMEGRDAAQLEDTLHTLFELLEDKFDAAGKLQVPKAHYRGAEIWNLGDKLSVARSGATLLAAQREAALKRLLDQAAGGTPGLAGRADFARSEGAQLALWFDRAGTQASAEAYGVDTRKLVALGKAAQLPQVQFLLGPGIANLGSAERFTAQLEVHATGLEAELVGFGPEKPTGLEPEGATPKTALLSTDALASGLFFRDVAAIVNRRNELFAPEMQPKFSKALGDLALLFGGMELDEDLLPAIGPWLEVTVRDMDFGSRPRPALALPGAALILTVDPAIKDTLVAGFQTTLGITNTQRAQNGEAAFTMGLTLEGDVLITSGHQPRPGPGEAIDNNFNLAPAAAYVEGPTEGWFVLGTHEAIVTAVVRELGATKRGEGSATPSTRPLNEELRVDPGALADLVRTSRDYLAMQAVLDEGKSFEQATAELDLLANIVGAFRHAGLRVEYLAGGDVRLGLELDLREPLPGTAPKPAGTVEERR